MLVTMPFNSGDCHITLDSNTIKSGVLAKHLKRICTKATSVWILFSLWILKEDWHKMFQQSLVEIDTGVTGEKLLVCKHFNTSCLTTNHYQ